MITVRTSARPAAAGRDAAIAAIRRWITQSATVVVAEAGDEMVCAGWGRYIDGSGFATLWGGSTLPDRRERGIYRAVVVYRARLAAARGSTYLQVDASGDSRPILERLGFVAVATTTPYVFRPPAG